MPPCLHDHSTSRDLYASPRLQACIVPLKAASVPPRQRVATLADDLQSFIALYLQASTSTRVQSASRPLYLNTSTSARLQRASRAPELHAAMNPTPLRRKTSTALAGLQSCIPCYFNVCTPATRLQRFMSLYLHVYTPSASDLFIHASTSLCLPHGYTFRRLDGYAFLSALR